MNNWKIWEVTLLTAFLFGALASYFAVKGHFQAKLATLAPEVDNLYVYPPKFPCEPPFSVTTSDDV